MQKKEALLTQIVGLVHHLRMSVSLRTVLRQRQAVFHLSLVGWVESYLDLENVLVDWHRTSQALQTVLIMQAFLLVEWSV